MYKRQTLIQKITVMKKFLFLAFLAIAGLSSCKSSKTVTDNTSNTTQSGAVENRTQQRPGGGTGERGGRGGQRDPQQMFTRMDANKDGKLSKDELRGPMVDRFDTIDTNKDGSISLEELKAAPRPQRGQRGQRPNGGGGK